MHLIGSTLGRYRLLATLGEGGMAVVYRAHDPAHDRTVAIKVLSEDEDAPEELRRRFAREGRVIRRLRHPHVLPVHAYEEADGRRFIVMPFAEGGTIAHRIRGGMPSRALALRWIREIASALDHAHDRGIVHRDLKPANVLLDASGATRLTDFGIAKLVASRTQLTRTGVVFGTPLYMSPEQAMGRVVDHRTDVYSLGVLAYELLTGTLPFVADTPVAVGLLHLRAPVPPAWERNPRLPRATHRVLARAMAKEPARRFERPGELAEALARSFRRVAAEEAELFDRPTLPARRIPRRTLGLRQLPLRGALLGLALPAAALAASLALMSTAPVEPVAPVDAVPRAAVRVPSAAPSPGPSDAPRDEVGELAELRDGALERAARALTWGDLESARDHARSALELAGDDDYVRVRAEAIERRAERELAAPPAPDPRISAALARAEKMERQADAARERADEERRAREEAERQAAEERAELEQRIEEMESREPVRVATLGGGAPTRAPAPSPAPAGGARRGGGGGGRGGR